MKVYNWKDVPETSPRPGVRRKAIRSSNALVVLSELDPGMETFPHTHDFEQLSFITKGQVQFKVGGEVYQLGPGSMFIVPPGIEHFAEPIGNETVINIDVFSPVREDYKYLVQYQEEQFE